MKMAKVGVTMIVAAFLFTGFFTVLAAAEGTSFEDAKVIEEGTYSGNVASDYYYKVTVPSYKALLVTLESGNDASVGLTLYNSNKQQVGLGAMASNGETDTAFYDGKSISSYLIYIQVSNFNFQGESAYQIKVEFRSGDVMNGAQEINNSQKVSGTLKAELEVHWYKINVQKGDILNVSFSSNGGEIYVALYDSRGQTIDLNEGTSGYVNTKLLGETGTIYIKVTSFEFQNRNISYTITPHLTKESSTLKDIGAGISMMCIGGAVVFIAIILLIVFLVMKKKK